MENRNVIKNFGYVSRMDNLQAAFLNLKFKKLKNIIKIRRRNAKIYEKELNKRFIKINFERKEEFNTYHTFVIQTKNRNNLKKYLESKGVFTSIHYPIPIHLQPAAKKFGYKKGDFINAEKQSTQILTLPINEKLRAKEIKSICKLINKFVE